MGVHYKTTDEYISSFPKEVQEILETIRKTIREKIPTAEEYMSYNIPAFKIDGKYIIYFSGWKQHSSLYPFSEAMEKALPESKNYKTSGKGTIQFPLDKPLPLPLIRKIVQFRLKESQKKDS